MGTSAWDTFSVPLGLFRVSGMAAFRGLDPGLFNALEW